MVMDTDALLRLPVIELRKVSPFLRAARDNLSDVLERADSENA
jgi:hypothetical protein